MTAVLQCALIVALSYLAGSIPTSVLVGRIFFGRDPRAVGSGSSGGTNAFRAFGWKGGVPTILIDVGKGVLATLLISRLPAPPQIPRELVQLIAGCSAVVGHIWTVFAGFHGGKGVGTAAGMVACLYPVALPISVGVFAIVLFSCGIVSVASMSAALLFPLLLLALKAWGIALVPPILFWFSIPMALLIVFTHRSNIRRLLEGRENTFPRLMIFARLFRRGRGASG